MKEKQIGFTLRINEDKWTLFTAIAALKRTTAVDTLRSYIDEYIEKNKALINIDAFTKMKDAQECAPRAKADDDRRA